MVGTAEGKIALVTGAGMGLGRGIALALAEQGASVAVNDYAADRADTVAGEIAKAGGKALPLAFDVRDFDQVKAGIAKIERELGPIDILCSNAGSGTETGSGIGKKFSESDPSDWSKSLDLDLMGSLFVLRTVLPGMVERGWGRIVQTSSAAGSKGFPKGSSIYGAAKAGIEGAMRHIAIEEAKSGVTVNCITPGILSNNAGRPSMESSGPVPASTPNLASVPIGRYTEPSEVAQAVIWLTSEAGAIVTGQTIHLNGGTMHGR